MGFLELFILAVGLSMDAFAVSLCKGLAMPECSWKKASACGIWFGSFQALMPVLGYFLGRRFRGCIAAVDHWVVFALLSVIGINMIREAGVDQEKEAEASMDVKTMFLMAVATSIDALAAGLTFAFLPDTNFAAAVLFIGICTFVISTAGAKIGNIFGAVYQKKAEVAGGVILILLGIRILLEHFV